MKTKIIILLLLMSLNSCLRENLITDIDIPNVSPKPVVYGLFTPVSDSLQINLRWALPIGQSYGLENDAIDNAKVWLIANNKDSIALQLRRKGVYSAAQKYFRLDKGKPYTVRIYIPNEKIVSATFQIPLGAAKFHSIKYDKAIAKNGIWYRKVTRQWYDISQSSIDIRYYTADKNVFRDDLVVYLNDTKSQEINGNMLSEYGEIGSTFKNLNNTFYLITTEKSVYDFLKASNIMTDIIRAKNVDLLTSFKGILPEYSNVTNGIGFVGGYAMSDTTIYIHD